MVSVRLFVFVAESLDLPYISFICQVKHKLKLIFLGTGTSQGVPVIGCKCKVCGSLDKKDKRLRASILVHIDNHNILIDIGPDFRYQMLRINHSLVDAILLTHQHRDHTAGLDDIRPIYFSKKKKHINLC